MRLNQICALLVAFALIDQSSANENWREVISEWNALKEETALNGFKDTERAKIAATNLRTWLSQSTGTSPFERNAQEKYQFELIDLTLAQVFLNAGQYSDAFAALESEVKNHTDTGGTFIYKAPVRNREVWIREVFSIHSEILAGLNQVKNIEYSGYKVYETASPAGIEQFVFVFNVPGNEEGQFSIQDVEPADQRWAVDLVASDSSGKYGVVDRAQVIADPADFQFGILNSSQGTTLTLGGVTKIIEYIGESGAPKVRSIPRSALELKILDGGIEQPVDSLRTDHEHNLKKKANAIPVSSDEVSDDPTQETLQEDLGNPIWLWGSIFAAFAAVGVFAFWVLRMKNT